MTPTATTIVVTIFVSLFGVCVGLGAFIARSVINRVGLLESAQIQTTLEADRLTGRVVIIEAKVLRIEEKRD